MAGAAPILMTVMGGLKMGAMMFQAMGEKDASMAQAKLQDRQAKIEHATGQREALAEQEHADFVVSEMVAKGGASGASLTDVDPIIARTADRGEYNALLAFQKGESARANLEHQADLTRHSARQKFKGAMIGMAVEAGKTAMGVSDKFGGSTFTGASPSSVSSSTSGTVLGNAARRSVRRADLR